MGCDIHLVLEQKHEGKWIGINTFPGHSRAKWALRDPKEYNYSSPAARDRNYVRFAKLAGVRGDGPDPLGIPADASDTTKLLIEQWGGDGHSHSYMPMDSAASVFLETERDVDEWAAKYPASHYFGIDRSDDDTTEYRVVFWFDN